MNSYLEELDYQSCIEKAFEYHIFEPDNSVYIYYILEGIRRYCYFDSKRWNKNFITDNYYIKIDNDGHKKKIPMEASLFTKFDLEIIAIDPNDAMKIKTKDYWRSQSNFSTYNEAFSHFCELGMVLNNPECILSNALSFGNDTVLRNKLLDSYLSFKNINHRAYAKALRHDSLYKSLPQKNILLISDFHVDVIHGLKKSCLGRNFKDKSGIIFETAKKSLSKNSTMECFLLDDLKSYRMNDYLVFSRMELLAFSPHMFLNRDLDLSYIEPNFWELFYKYGVNTIEFNNIRYTPAIDSDNSFESLKNILNIDHKDMWFNSFEMAYYSMSESKFSINNNSFRNSISLTADYKLLKNDQTRTQLQNLISTKKGLSFYDYTIRYWGKIFTHR
ncbi:MAG: hypothetical protein IPN99_06220 [Bacteroidetes bacterium]|nr:hypothetical protein [Bacteroidota bacterium]